MIVSCESCNTKFRLDPGRLKGSRKVRCSRCGKVFKVSEPEEDLIKVDLSDEIDLDGGVFEEPAPQPRQSSKSAEAPAGIPSSKKRKRPPLRWMIIVFAGLVLLGGLGLLIGVYKDSIFPSEPVPERSGGKEISQPAVSIMDSTQAYFLQNARVGQIFVIEGEVSNESGKPVSFVMLEGKLYTKKNQIAQSQRCYSGNPIARNELTQLGPTEIQNRMMNREGKDMLNVHIPISKRIPFMLVFHNLPELDALSEYSIEVISAKAE